MAKISELSNKQLVANISKYQKTLDGLLKERVKRLKAGQSESELHTPEELKAMEEEKKRLSEMDQFSLNLADEDIEAIEQVKDESKVKEDDEDELVRVTTLLRLSKDQLQELQKAKEEGDAPAKKSKGLAAKARQARKAPSLTKVKK